jgi:hypothetical protein
MEWTRILAYITGTVDQELLLRNDYLSAKNRILRAQLMALSDTERAKLADIGFGWVARPSDDIETLPRSVNGEYLSKIIPFGERSLRGAMKDYVAHYHTERNHQGKNSVLLFHRSTKTNRDKRVLYRERLRGLLPYYHREAA